MSEPILEFIRGAISSPWFYLALFALVAVDGFFPLGPSESLVITAGVFAASGEPDLLLVIAVAAAGAFAGDHVSYLIGRTAGVGLLTRTPAGTRRRAAFDWAARVLAERGGLILVAARYVPGGRTAATLTTGAVRFPLRSFARYEAIAALTWAAYSALVGYLGGVAFEHDPLKGLTFGLGMALTITALVEAVRYLRNRPSRSAGETLPEREKAPV